MRQLATLSRKEKYLWMCQLHISFGCVLKLKVLLLLIQFLYLSLKYWCMTRTRVWCSICKEEDGGGGKRKYNGIERVNFFLPKSCNSITYGSFIFWMYIQTSKSKHLNQDTQKWEISHMRFQGGRYLLLFYAIDLMIPFFKAAIFCFLMVYSMMPLTITSQKKTKKNGEEDHWGEALWLSDGRRCW